MRRWRGLAGACLAFASAAQSLTPEQEIEFAARDSERVLNRAVLSGDAYGANAVLQAVVDRLTAAAPHTALSNCRVQLMKGVRPSAFALPNCRVYVSTALFMTLENEAQLAALLARELAHVQLQSAVKQRVMMAKRENDAKAFYVVLAALAGTAYNGSIPNNTPTVSDATGDLIWRVSVGGYLPELESAADAAGVARFREAGFAPADAQRALTLLTETLPKDCGCSLPLLASPRYLEARTAALRQLTPGAPAAETAPDVEYAARAARLRLEQAQLLIDAGEFQDASHLLLAHIDAHGENGVTHFLAGEMLRRQGVGSRSAALQAYEKGAVSPTRLRNCS